MESLYLLIPISIAVVVVGVLIFFWAVNNGQYDDLDGEAERILFDRVDITQPTKPIKPTRPSDQSLKTQAESAARSAEMEKVKQGSGANRD